MKIRVSLLILTIFSILCIIIQSCRKTTDEPLLEKENVINDAILEESKSDTDIIKIAAIFAKTGAAAASQEHIILTVKLAEEEINSKGGILGKQVEFIEIDNQSTSIGAKSAARQAISEGVVAVIGCARSSNSLAAAPVLQQAKIIMISPGSTNPKVTQIGDYIFRVCFLDSMQGMAMANFAINDLNSEEAVVLTNTTYSYSIDLSEFFSRHYKSLGGHILWEGDFIENMSDFSSILEKVKELDPDVIYLPAYVRDSGLIIRQARQMGILSIFLGGDGWGEEFITYGKEAVNGSYLTDHWHHSVDRENSREFVRKYEKKYNIKPRAGSALTYDAIYILLNAITGSGSLDTVTIREYLANSTNFDGITGNISFDENGDPVKSVFIIQVDNFGRKYIKSIEP